MVRSIKKCQINDTRLNFISCSYLKYNCYSHLQSIRKQRKCNFQKYLTLGCQLNREMCEIDSVNEIWIQIALIDTQ